MQTRQERNKRATERRTEKQMAQEQSRFSSMTELWIKAKQEKMLLSQMQDKHTTIVEKLPRDLQVKLYGFWNGMMAYTYRQDVRFCYKHPDTQVITDSTQLCNEVGASRIDTNTGGFYWKNDDGTFSHLWH